MPEVNVDEANDVMGHSTGKESVLSASQLLITRRAMKRTHLQRHPCPPCSGFPARPRAAWTETLQCSSGRHPTRLDQVLKNGTVAAVQSKEGVFEWQGSGSEVAGVVTPGVAAASAPSSREGKGRPLHV